MNKVTIGLDLMILTCCQAGCGLSFAVPEHWYRKRREDHSWWYCPNGHQQHFAAKSEAEKLREQLARTERDLKWQADRSRRLADDNMTLARSRRALRGVVTRLKRQAVAGRCAFCDHEFPDVVAHVAEAHPGIATEASDEDEAAL